MEVAPAYQTPRDPHRLTPTMTRVPVTTALKQYAKSTARSASPSRRSSAPPTKCATKNVFRFAQMRFLTYDA
jgi:hypothetical protein